MSDTDNYTAEKLITSNGRNILQDIFIILGRLNTTNHDWLNKLYFKIYDDNPPIFYFGVPDESVNLSEFKYKNMLESNTYNSRFLIIFIILHYAKIAGKLDVINYIKEEMFHENNNLIYTSIETLHNTEHFDDVLEIMKECDISLNVKFPREDNYYNTTCLFTFIYKFGDEVADKMINAGFDINMREYNGYYSLFLTKGDVKAVKYLIDKGVVLHVDGYEKTDKFFSKLTVEILELLSTLENFDDFLNNNKDILMKSFESSKKKKEKRFIERCLN